MRDDHILLGGEVRGTCSSGENWYGVDDRYPGLVQVPQLASQTGGSILGLFRHPFPHLVATPEAQGPLPRRQKFAVVDELAAEFKRRYETIDIDGVRIPLSRGLGPRAGLEHQTRT